MNRRRFFAVTGGGLASVRAAQVGAQFDPVPEVRLLFGGDVMLSRNVGRVARERRDPSLPFREIASAFQQADIGFVNLESPFTRDPRKRGQGMIFKALPEMAYGLKHAGVDVVSTANNHVRDCGAEGVQFTRQVLAGHGIHAAGTGGTAEEAHRGVILSRYGIRFGFLAYTYDQRNGNYFDDDDRIAMMDLRALRNDMAALRTRADVVIVSMHAGAEYRKQPNSQQVEFGQAAIDAGASLVVGHHPHVVQQVEVYKNGLILYSLGNLIFDQKSPKETTEGLLAEVIFRQNRLSAYRLVPVAILGTVPVLAADEEPLLTRLPVAGTAG